MSRRSHRPSPIKQFILWSLLACVLIVTALGLYGYFWVQSYLRSDAIRVMLEARLGQLAEGEAKLTTLEWSGPAAYISTASLTPGEPTGWRKVEAEGVQAQVDWSGIREGVWRIPVVAMDWLKLELTPPSVLGVQGATPVVEKAPVSVVADAPTPVPPPSAPAWLQGWIPQRTDVQKVEVASLEVGPPKGAIGTRLREAKLVAKPAVDSGAWALEGREGKLLLPGWKDELNLQVVNARLDSRALAINHGSARWLGDSEITARGELPFQGGRPWKFSGAVTHLELRHVLPPAWQNKLHGVLEADYEVEPGVLSASVTVKNGVVENLPLLTRIADFTRTDRFRRVALEQAEGDVTRRGADLEIRKLVLQSSGLLRVEGDLDIKGRDLSGILQVGVSTDALRWMPGAQTQVFTESRPSGPPGFAWTEVRLTGTLDSPREDLSNRLLAAMGKELIAAPLGVAGKGIEILGSAGGEPGKGAAEVGKEVLKTTEDAAGKVMESGADLLKGVVPLFGK